MLRRLSVRIALLILIGAPLNFFLFINIDYAVVHWLGVPESRLTMFVEVGLLIVSTPLFIGLLATRYVTRPLERFVTAIEKVQHSTIPTELKPSGMREFDKVFAAFNALTQRLAAEEDLRKNLISDTSHELNTPLTAMLSQLTAIQDGILPANFERIAVLTQQTERLIDLVAQLDAYTRARLPGAASEVTAISLLEFCQHLEEMFKPLLTEQNMHLEYDVPYDYTLIADRTALEHILTNLIQNGVRHSGGSLIKITARSQCISVSDDGNGVAREHLPLLFERFYRVESSRSRVTSGLGLGLAIVCALAEGQGWHVYAEDAQPGLRVVLLTS